MRQTIPVRLVQEELDAIIEKDFPIQRIDQFRDIFVFCCYLCPLT
jgi:hypothetical protein